MRLPSIPEILAILHYDSRWLEFGFVSEIDLRNQFSKSKVDIDENLEHYRYESFCKSISSPTITDVKLDQYIQLAEIDEDETMAQAALAHLLKHRGLTELQWEHIKQHPAFKAFGLQQMIDRNELLRRLASSEITEDLFAKALSSGDREVQQELLKNTALSRQQLITLGEQGSTRAIRNLAKERARRF